MIEQRNADMAPGHRSAQPRPRTADELVATVEAGITDGALQPGTRLTPVRAAAAELGLAPNTVAAAYRKLQERGLVVGEGRRGTFVACRPAVLAPVDQPVIDGLIDLATGNPDRRLLPDLRRPLGAIDPAHVIYGAEPIDDRLATALAADLGPDLGSLVPDGIVAGQNLAVVGGALDGIERTLLAHLRPADRVAVEDPAYTSVLDLASAMNLRTVPVAVDRYGVIPEALAEALVDGVQAVIITPRAQNPTGAALDRDRADRLGAVLAGHPRVVVIEDDHAGPVAGVPYRGAIPDTTQHWAVIRSVAKSLGPDLRLAGLVGDPTTVNRVIGRQLLGTGWVSHILQQTVAELLSAPTMSSELEAVADTYGRRRSRFVDRLARAGIPASGRSGLNVWVPVADEAAVVAGMQRRGYAIRSGARFRQQAGPAVRVSTACSDVETLTEAADALAEVIGGGIRARSV